MYDYYEDLSGDGLNALFVISYDGQKEKISVSSEDLQDYLKEVTVNIDFTDGNDYLTCAEILCMEDFTIIDPHSHSWGEAVVVIEGDCENDGLNRYTCSVCSIVKNEIVPKGHIEVTDEKLEPTCTEYGLTAGSHCSRCGETVVMQTVIPAIGHDFADGVLTREATCSEEGVMTYTCQRCSETENKPISKTAHKWMRVQKKAATCTEGGTSAGWLCENCGQAMSELLEPKPIEALGHDYSISVITKAATCISTGVKKYTCSRCGEIKTEAYITTEHTYGAGKVTKEATCTKAGVMTYTCKYCKATKTERISANGHTVVTDKAVAATCTKAGKTAGTHCSVCKTVLTAQRTVKVKGHTVVTDKAVASTYTKKGLTEGIHCSVCGTVLKKQKKTAKKKLATPAVKKLTKKSKGFKLTWKKVSTADGYQIQYATNSKFTSGKKTKTVKGASSKSKTVKKLKGKKKYYVRIRAYKTVDGKKIYSAWSEAKSVKTKK